MINRKIAMSGLSILAAFAMMGGSAFAAFTAQATTTGNTFSTSNPTLKVSTDGVNFSDSKPGFNVTGLIPGTTSAAQPFSLKNEGTDNLPVTAKFNFNPVTNTLPGGDVDFAVECGQGTVSHTYSDWISTGFFIGNVNAGQTVACTMTATLHAGVGNEDLNKSAVFDALFTGSIGS